MEERVKISLKKPEPLKTPPAAAAVPNAAGITGTLPLPDRAFIMPTSMTPAERKMWEAQGYRPGDPLPVPTEDLAPHLRQAVADVSREARTGGVPPAPLDTPPLVVPPPVDIATLPAEHQAQIQEALELGRQQMKNLQTPIGPPLPGVDPSINAAITGSSVRVIDDRPKAPPKEEPLPLGDKLETLADEAEYCPHCGWPQHVKEQIEITDEDKRLFLLSQHGPLFQKEFELHGGYSVYRIRELTPSEVDMCHQQAHREVLRNEIGLADYKERVQRLRICLQLARCAFNGEAVTALPESIDDWDVEPSEGDTKLRPICEYVYKNVLRNESMHRTVAYLVNKFNSLKARLEARVDDPDFYKRTASPR